MIPIGLIALGIVVAVLVFAFALCNIAADDKGDDDLEYGSVCQVCTH